MSDGVKNAVANDTKSATTWLYRKKDIAISDQIIGQCFAIGIVDQHEIFDISSLFQILKYSD